MWRWARFTPHQHQLHSGIFTMNTRSILSTAGVAVAMALPAVASAQFVVTNQTGSSTVNATTNELAPGTLVSGGTSASFYGSITSKAVLGFSASETSTVAADQLSLSAELFNNAVGASSAPPPYYALPSGTTQGTLSFTLAQDAAVSVATRDSVEAIDHFGLFRLTANGEQQSIALPALVFNSSAFGWARYFGNGQLNLAAGDYVLKIGLSGTGTTFGVGAWVAGVTLTALSPTVPEPATWATLGLGLVGLAVVRRRRQG